MKEENCRNELGRLNMELGRIENQMAHDRNEIDKYYQIQEGALKNGKMNGSQLQAFPMLVAGKQRNIELLEKAKQRQLEMIEEKKRELAQLRGDLKIIENMKDKDFQAWRKATNKQIDEKVEEQTQNWLSHNKGDEV